MRVLFLRGHPGARARDPGGFRDFRVDGLANQPTGGSFRFPRRRGDVPHHDACLSNNAELQFQRNRGGGQRPIQPFGLLHFIRRANGPTRIRQPEVREQLAGLQRGRALPFGARRFVEELQRKPFFLIGFRPGNANLRTPPDVTINAKKIA